MKPHTPPHSKNASKGFALLDAFLALVIVAVGSYATFTFAKSYGVSSSVQTLEQRALTVSQNYQPFLEDSFLNVASNSTPTISQLNQISTDFLSSIGFKAADFVNSSGSGSAQYANLYTGTTINQKNTSFAFQQYTSAANSDNSVQQTFFAIGFQATQSQLVKIVQDLNASFSIFYSKPNELGTALSGASSVTAQGLPPLTSDNPTYAVFLVTPKILQSSTLSNPALTAPTP